MYEVPSNGDPARSYATINALNKDGEVLFEGMVLRKLPGEIEAGDTYVGQRNTGPQLLTCKRNFSWERNPDANYAGWIEAVEPAYSFNTNECVRVEIVGGKSD